MKVTLIYDFGNVAYKLNARYIPAHRACHIEFFEDKLRVKEAKHMCESLGEFRRWLRSELSTMSSLENWATPVLQLNIFI